MFAIISTEPIDAASDSCDHSTNLRGALLYVVHRFRARSQTGKIVVNGRGALLICIDIYHRDNFVKLALLGESDLVTTTLRCICHPEYGMWTGGGIENHLQTLQESTLKDEIP